MSIKLWYNVAIAPYGGGMVCVFASSKHEAHGLLVANVSKFKVECYPIAGWTEVKDVEVISVGPMFIRESSYIE